MNKTRIYSVVILDDQLPPCNKEQQIGRNKRTKTTKPKRYRYMEQVQVPPNFLFSDSSLYSSYVDCPSSMCKLVSHRKGMDKMFL